MILDQWELCQCASDMIPLGVLRTLYAPPAPAFLLQWTTAISLMQNRKLRADAQLVHGRDERRRKTDSEVDTGLCCHAAPVQPSALGRSSS